MLSSKLTSDVEAIFAFIYKLWIIRDYQTIDNCEFQTYLLKKTA